MLPKTESRGRTPYTQVADTLLVHFGDFLSILNSISSQCPHSDHTQERAREEESIPLEAMRAAGSLVPGVGSLTGFPDNYLGVWAERKRKKL